MENNISAIGFTEADFTLIDTLFTDYVKLKEREAEQLRRGSEFVKKEFIQSAPQEVKQKFNKMVGEFLQEGAADQKELFEDIALLKSKLIMLKRQLVIAGAFQK